MQYRLMGVKHLDFLYLWTQDWFLFFNPERREQLSLTLHGKYIHCTSARAFPPDPYLFALPELKHPSHSTIGGALVPMSFLPDAFHWLVSQWKFSFSHFSVTAAEQKNVQQPDWSSMPPNAYKSKMQDGASCMEPHLTLYPAVQFQKQCGILTC